MCQLMGNRYLYFNFPCVSFFYLFNIICILFDTIPFKKFIFQAERYVSILTAGAIAGAVIAPSLAVDHSLAILIPLHTHWGLEQVIF